MFRKKDKFWDLKKVPVFYNKKTGQMSIVLPKKKMRGFKHKYVRVRLRP